MSKLGKSFIIFCLLIAAIGLAFVLTTPRKANAPQTITPQANNAPPTTSIFFAGDIMLSRNVHRQMQTVNDFTLPFKNVADIIRQADIAFANLESPFNNTGLHFVDHSLIFNADPKSVAGLNAAGFDILSTANNHSLDQGQVGLDLTFDLLKTNNIIPVGTISSKANPVETVIEKNDILYGFLAYSYTALNDGGKSTSPYINDFNDLTKLKQDILDMKGHTADVVIVSMHAGTEYERNPHDKQIAFAHAAIDAGADLVIGHHPHWIQTIEKYKDKYIFYSLGNFVFDQMFSQDTREGLTLLVTYDKQAIKKIELKPIIIEEYCCPRWADEAETKSILQKIGIENTQL